MMIFFYIIVVLKKGIKTEYKQVNQYYIKKQQ